MLQVLNAFGMKALPSEAEIGAFQYDTEDLVGAVTHCISPSLALPFLPGSKLVAYTVQNPIRIAASDPAVDLVFVDKASHPSHEKLESSNETPNHAALQNPVPASASSNTLLKVVSNEGAASTTEVSNGTTHESIKSAPVIAPMENEHVTEARALDFDGGYVLFEHEDEMDLSGCTVSIETGFDEQKHITFFKPGDPGIDRSAAKFLQESAEANSTIVDYPVMDLIGRPRYAFNRKYRLGYNEDGSLIMRAQANHISHFEFAEHMALGQELQLRRPHKVQRAADKKLKLQEGLDLLYGEINALGGDFYGDYYPICQGKDSKEQRERFIEAYNCLAEDPRGIDEVPLLLKDREKEVKALSAAIRDGTSPAAAYKQMEKEEGLFGHEAKTNQNKSRWKMDHSTHIPA